MCPGALPGGGTVFDRGGMIDAYLTDTITLISHTGNDQWGEPSTPAETTVKARVEFGFKSVRSATGAVVVASGD